MGTGRASGGAHAGLACLLVQRDSKQAAASSVELAGHTLATWRGVWKVTLVGVVA
jgi:hypothetical protein